MTAGSSPTQPIKSSSDLALPLYLNQDHTFGLLAQLEDGFSTLHTIKTSTSETESTKSAASASIGASNIFAFLGVSLSGDKGKERGTQGQAEKTEERVHTPTSLFSKLRSRLIEREFLKIISSDNDIEHTQSGDFVEFRALLQRNPLVETLEGFKRLFTLFNSASPEVTTKRSGGVRGPDRNAKSSEIQLIDTILADMTEGDAIEIVGKLLGPTGMTAVLSTRLDYFVGRLASEIIDGE